MKQRQHYKNIIEAALLAAGEPITVERIANLFVDDETITTTDIHEILNELSDAYADHCLQLRQTASGYRMQVRQEFAPYIARLWEEKPPRYSRAILETLALIAYQQPITRAQIEDVRGVSVSSNIIRTLLDRNWIRIVGHKELPGRPALFATTKQFLDDFNLKSLDELPTLAEITDLTQMDQQIQLDFAANTTEALETVETVETAEVAEATETAETAEILAVADIEEILETEPAVV